METTIKNFCYLAFDSEYSIWDLSEVDKSDRTIDINVNELAVNEKLLDLLKLESLYSNRPNAVNFFCCYLSAFGKDNSEKYDKLITNSILRILVVNEELLKEIKKVI
jgi:hypothetical protein